MITVRRALPIPISYTLLVLSLLFFSGAALSQDAAVAVPDHAAPIEYGKGWECNQGYRDAGNSCDAIVVPENAYPTYAMYGTGWKCERGYRATADTCTAIKVPDPVILVHCDDRLVDNPEQLHWARAGKLSSQNEGILA